MPCQSKRVPGTDHFTCSCVLESCARVENDNVKLRKGLVELDRYIEERVNDLPEAQHDLGVELAEAFKKEIKAILSTGPSSWDLTHNKF